MRHIKVMAACALTMLLSSHVAFAWDLTGTVARWDTPPFAPYDIEVLSDGSVWLTDFEQPDPFDPSEEDVSMILFFDPSDGWTREFEVPFPAQFFRMGRGLDDTLWMPDKTRERNQIVRFEPPNDPRDWHESGQFTAYELPGEFNPEAEPFGVTIAPDGKVWFTCLFNDRCLGSFDPATEEWDRFPLPLGGDFPPGSPIEIAFDSEGNVWFTLARPYGGNPGLGKLNIRTRRITLLCDPSLFPSEDCFRFGDGPLTPWGIALVDGMVWFSDHSQSCLLRYNPLRPEDGFSCYPTPEEEHWDTHYFAVDPDGVFWLAGFTMGGIGTFDPATETFDSLSFADRPGPMGITISPDGEVWWAEDTRPEPGGVGRFTPLHTATWAPDLPEAGVCGVYAWWTAGPENATAAPYSICYDGGTSIVTMNQQTDGGRWNLLGEFPFAAGDSGYVELSNDANGRVIADAIGFDCDGDGIPDVVVDDGDSGFSLSTVSWSCIWPVPGAYDDDLCYLGDTGDFDYDGIHDRIDIEPARYSDEFSDGTTSGVVFRGDQEITVTDEPNAGVRITASCEGGERPAMVAGRRPTGVIVRERLDPCKEIIFTTGSTIVGVIRGPVEVEVGEDVIVTVPTGAEVTVSEVGEGVVNIANTGDDGDITVEHGNRTESLESGESVELVLRIDMECFEVNFMRVIDRNKGKGRRDKIKVAGSLRLPECISPFDPELDIVIVTLDDLVIRIPGGSFKPKDFQRYLFNGKVSGVGRVKMGLNFTSCRWWIKIGGVDVSELVKADGASVRLSIGESAGDDGFYWTGKWKKGKVGFAKFVEPSPIKCCLR